MKTVKELIIVHVQNGYMKDITVPRVRQTMLRTINALVDDFVDTTPVSFWLDYPYSGGKSAIDIEKHANVTTYEAPAGAVDYKLKTNTVNVTGLWFGACVNNAIISLVKAYVKDSTLSKQGKLTINLESNGICKPSKLLEEMYAEPIISTLLSGFKHQSTLEYFENTKVIQERGLAVSIIRQHSDPEKRISQTEVLVEPKKTLGTLFLIVLNVI